MITFPLKLKKDTSASRRFAIKNSGGGFLYGRLTADRNWIKIPPAYQKFDIRWNSRQDITFDIDASGLPFGCIEEGTIDVTSLNGGTERVVIKLSIEELIVHPWIRLWARCLDTMAFSFIGGVILSAINPDLMEEMPGFFFGMLTLLFWVFIEPILLSTWGTTPGKWFLKTTLRNSSGRKLSFGNAISRSLSVWIKGLGMGFPIASLILLILAYKKLKKDSISAWDKKKGFIISHTKVGKLNISLAIFLTYLLLGLLERLYSHLNY